MKQPTKKRPLPPNALRAAKGTHGAVKLEQQVEPRLFKRLRVEQLRRGHRSMSRTAWALISEALSS